MLKKDVVIGAVYIAKISGNLVEVEILSTMIQRGYGPNSKDRTHWLAKNLKTGRGVTIKSAAKLRRKVATADQVSMTAEGMFQAKR